WLRRRAQPAREARAATAKGSHAPVEPVDDRDYGLRGAARLVSSTHTLHDLAVRERLAANGRGLKRNPVVGVMAARAGGVGGMGRVHTSRIQRILPVAAYAGGRQRHVVAAAGAARAGQRAVHAT